jgi:hypothetical protein
MYLKTCFSVVGRRYRSHDGLRKGSKQNRPDQGCRNHYIHRGCAAVADDGHYSVPAVFTAHSKYGPGHVAYTASMVCETDPKSRRLWMRQVRYVAAVRSLLLHWPGK